MARISFEQKGTKETKVEFFFVDFVCFCFNSVPRAARMEDSQSVKSGAPGEVWLIVRTER
jgi:hypothetical protein